MDTVYLIYVIKYGVYIVFPEVFLKQQAYQIIPNTHFFFFFCRLREKKCYILTLVLTVKYICCCVQNTWFSECSGQDHNKEIYQSTKPHCFAEVSDYIIRVCYYRLDHEYTKWNMVTLLQLQAYFNVHSHCRVFYNLKYMSE